MATQSPNRASRNEINLGIMGTKIDNIEGAIAGMRQDIKDLSTKMDSNYITRMEFENLKNRVEGIENGMSWVIRLIVGAVITAVLALIFVSR
jgi:hypothetical protein